MRGTTAPLQAPAWRRLVFQSPCPVRGTTRQRKAPCPPGRHFNPRAPCGARPVIESLGLLSVLISIPVPRAGHDGWIGATVMAAGKFQSPCPVRGTTWQHHRVSIQGNYFNPRAPCGARPGRCRPGRASTAFQSPCPVRGTTAASGMQAQRSKYFNPRAPCGARLLALGEDDAVFRDFNPRAPCGARRF